MEEAKEFREAGSRGGMRDREAGSIHEAHAHAWLTSEPQDGVHILRKVTPKVGSLFCTLGLQ